MIRPLTMEDASEMCRIEELCFEDPWKLEEIENEWKLNPYSHQAGLFVDGKLAGFAIYWITFETCQLADLAVDPAFRRQGFGRLLLQHVLTEARQAQCESLLLEVRPSNRAARELYESSGLIPVRTISHYYKNGEDAIAMAMGL